MFSDISQAEFESRYLTADPTMKTGTGVVDATVRTVDTTTGLVDWTGKWTTAVKDQVNVITDFHSVESIILNFFFFLHF